MGKGRLLRLLFRTSSSLELIYRGNFVSGVRFSPFVARYKGAIIDGGAIGAKEA